MVAYDLTRHFSEHRKIAVLTPELPVSQDVLGR
jgi:hypothetical protein